MSANDTIVAVASPPGGAARGIVRLSGSSSRDLALGVVEALPEKRGALRSRVRLPGDLSFPAVLYHMPSPGSYTGEDIVEIHTVGSPPLLRLLLDTLVDRGGRLANPGEFTQRSYLNGRMDLAQAEAVQSVIQARNLEEVRAARQQLEGAFSKPLGRWEGALLDLCADVEASIDFVDQDIEIISREEISRRLSGIHRGLSELLQESRLEAGTRPVVALYGPPNAGKSTLFNRLTEGDAIVSDRAGTTRDVLSGSLDSIRVLDLAGDQVAVGVDAEAVDRSRKVRDEADLVLFLVDARDPERADGFTTGGRPTIFVVNKSDQVSSSVAEDLRRNASFVDTIAISAKVGDGVEELIERIRSRVDSTGENPSARFQVSVRQRAHLHQGRASLEEASRALVGDLPVELIALDLRSSCASLGAVTGRDVSEEILDRIFRRFCLGK